MFVINCYQTQDGNTITADRDYCLGDHARVAFLSRENAESAMADLQADVGDVVDESVEYEIGDLDSLPDGWTISDAI